MKKVNWKGYLEWRNKYIDEWNRYDALPFYKKIFKKEPGVECHCVMPLSWASRVHDIVIHVCSEHARQFGIMSGPYWDKDVERMEEMSKKSTIKK